MQGDQNDFGAAFRNNPIEFLASTFRIQTLTSFINNTFSLNHYLLNLKFLRLQNKSETISHFITVVSV